MAQVSFTDSPDEEGEEILARLLALNLERARWCLAQIPPETSGPPRQPGTASSRG